MSGEMAERLERALQKTLKVWPDGRLDGLSVCLAARAAIEAMREPTEAMKKALYDFGPSAYLHGSEVWPALIDEALK